MDGRKRGSCERCSRKEERKDGWEGVWGERVECCHFNHSSDETAPLVFIGNTDSSGGNNAIVVDGYSTEMDA